MAKASKPRAGSLQFWPRKRAEKQLPSVNWTVIHGGKDEGILGFITYKVGMASAVVKDDTLHSMTKGKKVVVPVTILEAPNMKIYSVRFYKEGSVMKDIIVSNDKELRRAISAVPKTLGSLDNVPHGFDDIRIIAYSIPSQTNIKKTPDLIELAVNAKDKLSFVKNHVGKELSYKDFLKHNLLDVRGLTTGRGLVGPVKRFGITLKQHKSEKGVRRPGSLAPWHPARVTYRTPMAGQLGMFTRVHYNLNLIHSGSVSEKDINPGTGFKHYGKVNSNYIIVKGSVQGPPKRQILLTPSFRPTKFQAKKKLEFQELLI